MGKPSLFINILRLPVLGLLMTAALSHAEVNSCVIPLKEEYSEPAIDLIGPDGPIDPDHVIDFVRSGGDSSNFEPQLSDLYVGRALPLQEYSPIVFPENNSVIFDTELSGTSGLFRARVLNLKDQNLAYQLQFSLDTHATLARNALLRKLGYAIPTPRYYKTLSVTFKNLEQRDSFLDHLADNTLTARGRWVVGGIDEINKNQLTLTFQDVALEAAVITVPAFHWGILVKEAIQSRRSIRALLVPLTILDIPESVNMYSFESAKIFNIALVLSRANADQFKNSTSIGDVRWISKKISNLTRSDWSEIIKAGYYPADIEALLIEKTLGRVNQFMRVIELNTHQKLKNNPRISIGKVVKGKATQENYPGYALRFAYGDPQSPLRASELGRFFGITAINAALGAGISQANQYMQVTTPQTYIDQHSKDAIEDFQNHIKTTPNEPYVAPLKAWGGPIFGVDFNASRNLVTGTYYGSTSQVQLVDTLSAGLHLGGFVGISGIPFAALGVGMQVQYQRSYVHVRPVSDIKAAWKDNWAHLIIPAFLARLGKTLNETEERSAATAMQEFLDSLKTGEMYIINDGVTTSNVANINIPVGALLGGVGVVTNLSQSVSTTAQYTILSRTTIYKDEEGIHVYLTRMNSGQFELALDTSFFIRLVSISAGGYKGKAQTRAYILPDHYDKVEDQRKFNAAMRTLVRRTNTSVLEEDFSPYLIDHKAKGRKIKIALGPFSFTKRENFHELKIEPPKDPDNRYNPATQRRSLVEGQITKIKGTNPYGFAMGIATSFVPKVNLGGLGSQAQGDDPAANFIGRSNALTIASQMETSEGRPNHLISSLSRDFRGWTMSKKKMFKLVEKLKQQLGSMQERDQLIDEDEFTQTKKIQAYSVLSNVIIYEKGLQRILDLLDLRSLSTKQVQNRLVGVMGLDEYNSWCKKRNLIPAFLTGPYALEESERSGTVIEYQNGQSNIVGCVTPWMKEIYRLRSDLSSKPELLENNIHDPKTAVKKIKLVNRLISFLENEMTFDLLFNWVGKENAFFQIKISGFRTKDENGDSEYFSNTIGKLDPEIVTGPFADIQDATGIQMNELQARYLSGGF